MFEFEVTSEFLTILVAGALAILFDYFPWIAEWFDGQKESTKKLLNVGLLVVFAGVLFGGDCAGWFVTNLVCTTKGFFDTLYIVFLALGVNYGVHKATKPSEALKAKMFGSGDPSLG